MSRRVPAALAAVVVAIPAWAADEGGETFLGLSTLMDVFITWYFTRPLVILLGRRNKQSSSALSIAAGMYAGGAHE